MSTAFLIACSLLLLGFILRARLRFLHALFIPASVVAGTIGFVAVQVALWRVAQSQGESPVWAATLASAASEWRTWPGWLIAVVFAGMLLERPSGSMRESLKKAASAGIFAWFIIAGQIALGLTAAWLVLGRLGMPRLFGQLLEVSWAGGFGSSNAWGEAMAKPPFNHADARDLATFFAAMGILWGVVSGIVLVNIAVRRGWTRAGSARAVLVSGLEPRRNPTPAAFAHVAAQVIDPLVFQALILAMAVVVGLFLQWATGKLGPLTHSHAIAEAMGSMPLFLFALLGGWIVRLVMQALTIDDLIDPHSLKRLTAGAMEFVIVSALAGMRLAALRAYAWPSLILMAIGAVWCIIATVWFARRMLPAGHWFELGIINYGMATATTAQGMMLLRIIDRDLESGAAEEYALAAPLSAPFIGGGIITYTLPVILLHTHVAWVIAVWTLITVVLWFIGRATRRRIECPKEETGSGL